MVTLVPSRRARTDADRASESGRPMHHTGHLPLPRWERATKESAKCAAAVEKFPYGPRTSIVNHLIEEEGVARRTATRCWENVILAPCVKPIPGEAPFSEAVDNLERIERPVREGTKKLCAAQWHEDICKKYKSDDARRRAFKKAWPGSKTGIWIGGKGGRGEYADHPTALLKCKTKP